jgi:hypothetical protein
MSRTITQPDPTRQPANPKPAPVPASHPAPATGAAGAILRSRGLWTHPYHETADVPVNVTPFAATPAPLVVQR